MKSSRPYGIDGRLADVIAAITVLAAHYKSESHIDSWVTPLSKPSDSIGENQYERWKAVFEDHPEFFIVYTLRDSKRPKAALRLRYAHRTIDPQTRQVHPNYELLSPKERSQLTSLPLAADVTGELVSVAINLHSAELARRADSRFWLPLIGPILGLIGGILVALVTSSIASNKTTGRPIKVELTIDNSASTFRSNH